MDAMNLSKHFNDLSKTTQEKELEHWDSIYATSTFKEDFKKVLKYVLENKKPYIYAAYGFSEATKDFDMYSTQINYQFDLDRFSLYRLVPNNETIQKLTKSLFSDLLVETYPFVGEYAKTNPSFYHSGGNRDSYVQFDNIHNLEVNVKIWLDESQIKIKDREDLPLKLKKALLECRQDKLNIAKKEYEIRKKEKEKEELKARNEPKLETVKKYAKELILKHIEETTPQITIITSDSQDRGEGYTYRKYNRTYHNFTYSIKNFKSTLVKDLGLLFISTEIYLEAIKEIEKEIQKELYQIFFYTQNLDDTLYLVFEKDITDELKRIYPIPTHKEDVWK